MEGAHGVASASGSASLLGDELLADHLLGVLLSLLRSAVEHDEGQQAFPSDARSESSRVDHLDSSLQSSLSREVSLSTSTSKHLSLDNELVRA